MKKTDDSMSEAVVVQMGSCSKCKSHEEEFVVEAVLFLMRSVV